MFENEFKLLVLLTIALLIFGPTKMASLGGTIGKSIRDFRNAVRGAQESFREQMADLKESVKEADPAAADPTVPPALPAPDPATPPSMRDATRWRRSRPPKRFRSSSSARNRPRRLRDAVEHRAAGYFVKIGSVPSVIRAGFVYPPSSCSTVALATTCAPT